MTCRTRSTCTAYWSAARQFKSVCTTTFATFRCTNISPGRSPQISVAGTRLSEQPIQTYAGDCCSASRAKKPGSRATRSAAHRRLFSKSFATASIRASPPPVAGQTEDPLRDDVPQHLARAAGDRHRAVPEVLPGPSPARRRARVVHQRRPGAEKLHRGLGELLREARRDELHGRREVRVHAALERVGERAEARPADDRGLRGEVGEALPRARVVGLAALARRRPEPVEGL